jgi:hypothetical protein
VDADLNLGDRRAALNDKVVAVASEVASIGRVVERGTSITKVKVRIHSVLAPASKP